MRKDDIPYRACYSITVLLLPAFGIDAVRKKESQSRYLPLLSRPHRVALGRHFAISSQGQIQSIINIMLVVASSLAAPAVAPLQGLKHVMPSGHIKFSFSFTCVHFSCLGTAEIVACLVIASCYIYSKLCDEDLASFH